MKPVDFPSSSPAATPAVSAETKPSDVVSPAGQPAASIPAVTFNQLQKSWAEILTAVNKISKTAWMVAFTLTVVDFDGDVLTLRFASQKDLDAFKTAGGGADALRKAIVQVLGVTVRFKAQIAGETEQATPQSAAPASSAPANDEALPPNEAAIEEPEVDEPPVEAPEPEPDFEPVAEATPEQPAKFANLDDGERYGESLLRDMLGATPINDKNGK